MQIKVLQFTTPPQPPQSKQTINLDSWVLVGNLKSPQFHQCLDILSEGKEKNLLNFEIQKLNPFDFTRWKQKNCITFNGNVVLQLNSKKIDFDTFANYCNTNYDLKVKDGNYDNRGICY